LLFTQEFTCFTSSYCRMWDRRWKEFVRWK